MQHLAIDLYCGLGGWAEGLIAEGWTVIGFDIEWKPYLGLFVMQDVRTIHGSQLKDASLIVGSSPCQEFSYRAMPWKRAKALPPPYAGIELFEAQFRIQREACEAAGRYIPMVVENVCGAQKWVGAAKWHYGSYYLWGDVPVLMPIPFKGVKVPGLNWSGSDKLGYKAQAFNTTAEQRLKVAGFRFDGLGRSFQSESVKTVGHANIRDGYSHTRHLTNQLESDAVKFGGGWWHDSTNNLIQKHGSKSDARKQASAQIAKIPFPLARHIAQVYKPSTLAEVFV